MPNDPVLLDVYAYAQDNNLPVMTHCSRGGVRNKKLSAIVAAKFADPDNYLEILERFPSLKICMGHCGGDQDWKQYLDQPCGTAAPLD
jgi:predicted TIM-barrel fold metal-dependent hydrolase